MAVAAVGGHAFEDRLPGRAAEEIVVDDEERRDAVTLARVPDPAHHRLRIPRPHRPPHHVLHAAVRAGEGAAARGVERRHRRRGEAPEVRVADRGELGLGDERHGDVRAAGLGADAIRHAVGRPELATEVVVEEIRPERLRLAHDGRDPALLEEAPRLGIAAHVEATEENGEACAPELAGEVAAARVLVRLHAGEPDQHLDAVLQRLLLDGADGGGQDRPVHLLVPDHGLDVDRVVGAESVVGIVQGREHGERVVREHALPEVLHASAVVVFRRLDEVDAERPADPRRDRQLRAGRRGRDRDDLRRRPGGAPEEEEAREEQDR